MSFPSRTLPLAHFAHCTRTYTALAERSFALPHSPSPRLASGCMVDMRCLGICVLGILLRVSALEILRTPVSIGAMMAEVAESVQMARASGLRGVFVEIPLPVTGGTELDDWPGGIAQKYNALVPMLEETMKRLDFSSSSIRARRFIGECGEEDSVGFWSDASGSLQMCCFPTVDSIPSLAQAMETSPNSTLVIVNQNFFINPLSSGEAKRFARSLETVYRMETLSCKGVGGISVRGLLYRKFPGDWMLARRLEAGEYEVVAALPNMPERRAVDEALLADSRDRDGGLSFLDRLRKQIPRFD